MPPESFDFFDPPPEEQNVVLVNASFNCVDRSHDGHTIGDLQQARATQRRSSGRSRTVDRWKKQIRENQEQSTQKSRSITDRSLYCSSCRYRTKVG